MNPRRHDISQAGFTLLAALAALFFMALATQQVMAVVSLQAQREREAELIHIGVAYRQAIGRYYEAAPGSQKTWPPTLEALLDDQRSVTLKRHLRRIYADPITREAKWGIVLAPGGGIVGVFSLSDAAPVRAGGRELEEAGLGAASQYRDWKFVYQPVAGEPSSGG